MLADKTNQTITPKDGRSLGYAEYGAPEGKAWLESQGYQVPENRILKVHWTSLAILDCPEMQPLLSWVRNREIDAD